MKKKKRWWRVECSLASFVTNEKKGEDDNEPLVHLHLLVVNEKKKDDDEFGLLSSYDSSVITP